MEGKFRGFSLKCKAHLATPVKH